VFFSETRCSWFSRRGKEKGRKGIVRRRKGRRTEIEEEGGEREWGQLP